MAALTSKCIVAAEHLSEKSVRLNSGLKTTFQVVSILVVMCYLKFCLNYVI